MTEEQNFLRGNTLYLLDFDQVRHLVSNFTTLPLSKEMALTMEPSFDHAEINKIKLELYNTHIYFIIFKNTILVAF